MAKLVYSNPILDCLSDDNSYGALSWTDQNGIRYHIWVNLPDYSLKAPTFLGEPAIFKNPPLDIDGQTRYLYLRHKKNQELVDQMIAEARVLDLLVVAKANKAFTEAAEQQKALEQYRADFANNVRDAARLFFDGKELDTIRDMSDKQILHAINIALDSVLSQRIISANVMKPN